MRFMVMVKATKDSEAGVMPSEQAFADMASSTRSSSRTGSCWRPRACNRAPRASACASPGEADRRRRPFTETKELVAASGSGR